MNTLGKELLKRCIIKKKTETTIQALTRLGIDMKIGDNIMDKIKDKDFCAPKCPVEVRVDAITKGLGYIIFGKGLQQKNTTTYYDRNIHGECDFSNYKKLKLSQSFMIYSGLVEGLRPTQLEFDIPENGVVKLVSEASTMKWTCELILTIKDAGTAILINSTGMILEDNDDLELMASPLEVGITFFN